MERVAFIARFAARDVIRIEMAIWVAERVIALHYDAKFLFVFEMAALCEEKPDRVVRVGLRLLIAHEPDSNWIDHRVELSFHQFKTGEEANALAVTLPHVLRFAIKYLPARYEVTFAVLPEESLFVDEPQLVGRVVSTEAECCSDVFVRWQRPPTDRPL